MTPWIGRLRELWLWMKKEGFLWFVSDGLEDDHQFRLTQFHSVSRWLVDKGFAYTEQKSVCTEVRWSFSCGVGFQSSEWSGTSELDSILLEFCWFFLFWRHVLFFISFVGSRVSQKMKHVWKTVVTHSSDWATFKAHATVRLGGTLGRQSVDDQSPAPPKLAEGCWRSLPDFPRFWDQWLIWQNVWSVGPLMRRQQDRKPNETRFL